MRVLIDCHCFDSVNTEGINTYIAGLYSNIIPLMPEADFYFAALDTQRLLQIFGNAKNVHYIALKSRFRFRRMILEYPMIVRKYAIDVAHFQYFSPPGIKCKVLITLHDLLFKDFPERFPLFYRISRDIVFRLSSRRADLLATVSEYSRDRISAHYGIPARQILVTNNGVSDDFFNIPLEEAKKYVKEQGIGRYILNVSRIEPRKNQLSLLRAYHELGLLEKGYDLVLINQHAIPVADLENYYNQLPDNEKKHIHRIENVNQKELKFWYRAADLFVFPSIAEGFGIPPLEAAAAGVPVICHNATGMAEFSFFGENQTNIEVYENLKNIIATNIATPKSAEELNKIKTEIHDKYNWKNSAEALRFAFLGIL